MRILREVFAIVAGIAAAALVFLACDYLSSYVLFDTEASRLGRALFATIAALLVVTALYVWYLVRKRLGLVGQRFPLLIRLLVAVLFLATWIVGVPAVISTLNDQEIATYKTLRDKHDRVWDAHPYITFDVALPIAPFVILTHHQYQLAGLYGWGGWEIHIWYIWGNKSVFDRAEWVS
jgi:hypothetical protein